MPTSGERAHFENLLLRTGGPAEAEWFAAGAMSDARRVHRLGNLYIFDYGDTPIETKEQEFSMLPSDLEESNKDNRCLLAANKRQYRFPADVTL